MPRTDTNPIPTAARITVAVAGFGVLLALLGTWIATRTVQTPLQDCGVAAAYLLDGRVDTFGDPADPPAGRTEADVRDNNATPCRERAANQAKPGAILIVAGTAIGLVAALVESLVRWRWRRHHPVDPSSPATSSPATSSEPFGEVSLRAEESRP